MLHLIADLVALMSLDFCCEIQMVFILLSFKCDTQQVLLQTTSFPLWLRCAYSDICLRDNKPCYKA